MKHDERIVIQRENREERQPGFWVRNRFLGGDAANARVYPALQTLGQSPYFRQSAPEIGWLSRVYRIPPFLTEIRVMDIIVAAWGGLIPLIAASYNIRILAASS